MRRPALPLHGLVQPYVGYLLRDGPPGTHYGLPSTSVTVVLAFDEPLEVGWGAASTQRMWSSVAGLHEQPALIEHRGFQHGIQLALTPSGSRALLGVPMAALLTELVTVEELVGPLGAQLYDEVAGAGSWAERFAALDAGLTAMRRVVTEQRDCSAPRRPVPAELRLAWRRLHEDPAVRVEALAGEVGWSRRRLHAAFVAEVGVGPKQVARVVRFRRARAGLVEGRSIASVAAMAGYSDQAHLTREFRALAGRSPAAWLREERPFVQDAGGGERHDRPHGHDQHP